MQGSLRRRIGWVAALVAVVGVAMPSAHARQALTPPTIDEVVARAAAYVERYVEELSTVVMEEDYRQTDFPNGRGSPSHTQLVSEFLLMRIQGVGDWIGFRDIFEVNGRQVRDRQDRLASLFLGNRTTALAQARRISEDSSRYNLGSTSRNINIPTFALFFLHPTNANRFRFEQDDVGCGDEPTAWEIRFEEVQLPTLTRGFENINLPASGSFCLDPESGRVIETAFDVHHPSSGRVPATDAQTKVTFGLDPRLNIWVPLEMREIYSTAGGSTTRRLFVRRSFHRFFNRSFQPGGCG